MKSVYSESVAFLKKKCPDFPRHMVVLGSGLAGLADDLTETQTIPFSDIPGFRAATAPDHSGALIIGRLGKKKIVCLKGRLHFYEGYTMSEVVFPFRVLALCGVEIFFITNAAGGMRKKMKPGDLMVITDHINLMGTDPLVGPNDDSLGPRFPDLTDLYDSELRKILKKAAKKEKINLLEGVYVAKHGPSYETLAEVRYLKTTGADAVGMSTVPEAIALRQMGKKLIGVSCISNLAAGMTGEKINHDEVRETGLKVQKKFGKLVRLFFEALP